ncbi:MAG: multicopper oxidase domain-containing protein, partial [Chloroflexi bacterium]|nr:multicopper oxidase domain-containing protein [Chloroflexota bacterium]
MYQAKAVHSAGFLAVPRRLEAALATLVLGAALITGAAAVASPGPAPATAASAPARSGPHPAAPTAHDAPEAGHDHGDTKPWQTMNAGHQGAEGFPLVGSTAPGVLLGGQLCPPGVPLKVYDVVALNVEITLNRFRDFDPEGKMYALASEVAAIRAKEAGNRALRDALNQGDFATITQQGLGPEPGLGDDPIQPLTLRANKGECVAITLTNQLAEPVGLFVQGAQQVLASGPATGETATAANPAAAAAPGGTVAYQIYLDPATHQEGSLQFRPSPAQRDLNSHGLFGALVVEEAGTSYLHTKTGNALCAPHPSGGQTCQSTWRAMIVDPNGSDFREAVIFYHEVGPDNFQPLDRRGNALPLVGPATGSYGIGKFALNYRSEQFEHRMELQQGLIGFADVALGFGSYTFGDPATPIVREYLGDPTKLRLVHGGSETVHVHHLHGGGDRWARQPEVPGNIPIDAGLTKQFPQFPNTSIQIDSQRLAPSETFETELACGAGGCQQGVGDYVFHCHVAHHYVSGMWGIIRVYNTLRVAGDPLHDDGLGALAELPDRPHRIPPGVTSDQLIGRTVTFRGQTITVNSGNLAALVESQLPPRGVPQGYDATVLDWERQGDRYLNEPNTTIASPNLPGPPSPGQRLPFLFHPETGKLAYPFLRTHPGQRPPFPPGHGPSPYFDPVGETLKMPAPGESGPDSLCPAGAPRKFIDLVAAQVPIQVSTTRVIEDGELFVQRDERAADPAHFREPGPKDPPAIRVNQGDCLDFTLTNAIPSTARESRFSKVNLHQHFVQFDMVGDDGSITGFNYETSVRPFIEIRDVPAPVPGKLIQVPAPAGATQVTVNDTAGLHEGILVMVGIDQDATFEIAKIAAINRTAGTLTLADPLRHPHAAGELLSAEFIRKRYFAAEQVGTTFIHDHAEGLESWSRGLFAAVIQEPRGSTYRDPRTGQDFCRPVPQGQTCRTGVLADILTDARVTPRMQGSFREVVLFVMDRNEDIGSSVNLKVEPLDR